MNRILGSCVLFCFTMLVASSCFQSDLDKISVKNWQPKVAIALVKSSFTTEDLLGGPLSNKHFAAGNDQIIHLLYNRTLLSKQGNELLTLPDLPFDITSDSLRISFKLPDNSLLTSLLLSQGTLDYQIASALGNETELTLTIPGLSKDGNPFSQLVDLVPDEQGTVSVNESIDLSGYELDLSGPEGDTVNVLDVLTTAIDQVTGDTLKLDNLSAAFHDLLYQYVEGYFSHLNLGDLVDTIKIDVFKNWIEGQAIFINPSIQITVTNSFGFPVVATFSSFLGYNGDLQQSLSGEVVNSNYVSQPADAGSLGNPSLSNISIDSSNSSIKDFLSITPRNIIYQVDLTGNIQTDFSTFNFLTDSSKVTVDMDLDMPLQGAIDGLLRDTFAIAVDTIHGLNSASIEVISENSFPHGLEIQIFMLDSMFQVVDSLIVGNRLLLESGVTDDAGRVIKAAASHVSFGLDHEGIAHLFQSRFLVIEARLATSGDGAKVVKYTTDNNLQIFVSAIVGINPEGP